MPVVEPTPHARKRALVRRGTLHSISSDEGSPRNSTVSPPIPQMPKRSAGGISPLTRSYSSLERATEERLMMDEETFENKNIDAEIFRGRPKAYTLPPGLLRKHINQANLQESDSNDERRSSASSTGSDVEPRRLSSICPPDLSTISEAKESDNVPTSEENDETSTPVVKKKISSSLDKINDFRVGRQYSIYNKFTDPDLDYNLEEYESIAPSMLQEVLLWDFAIDQLEKVSNSFILSRVS